MYSNDYGVGAVSDQPADFELGPDETRDYGFAWAGRLDGDTITASTFELPDGLTETDSSFSDTDAVIFVSGAQEGARYRIKNTVTTSGGRVFSKTIWIVGKEV